MTDLGGVPENSISAEVRVGNSAGLHARPAAKLAKLAQGFGSEISLCVADQEVDAKSILDILTLAASQGSTLVIRASGDDAGAALEALISLFNGGFSEE